MRTEDLLLEIPPGKTSALQKVYGHVNRTKKWTPDSDLTLILTIMSILGDHESFLILVLCGCSDSGQPQV